MPKLNLHGTDFWFVWVVPGSSGGVGYPEESFLVDNARATGQIRCPYDKRIPLIEALSGYSWVVNIGGKNILKRRTPYQYPYKRGLYCVGSPRSEGMSPSGETLSQVIPRPTDGVAEVYPAHGQPDYLDAKVNLLFTNLPYKVMDDILVEFAGKDAQGIDVKFPGQPDEGEAISRGIRRYVKREARPAGQFLQMPGNALFFKHSGTPTPGAQGSIFIPALDLIYTWHNIPENGIPLYAWSTIPGTINRYPFDGWPAQTLLCQNPTFKQTTTQFGIPRYDIQYRFKFLPNYEKYPDPVTGPLEFYRGHNWFPAIGLESDNVAGPPVVIRKGKLIYKEVCTRGTTPDVSDAIGGVTVKRPAGSIDLTKVASPTNPMDGSPVHKLSDFRDLFRPPQPTP